MWNTSYFLRSGTLLTVTESVSVDAAVFRVPITRATAIIFLKFCCTAVEKLNDGFSKV